MSRIIFTCIFFIGLSMAYAKVPLIQEEPTTKGDSSSNTLQTEVDDGSETTGQAEQNIDNDNFDSSDGGLYCPNNQCEDDPNDAANGF